MGWQVAAQKKVLRSSGKSRVWGPPPLLFITALISQSNQFLGKLGDNQNGQPFNPSDANSKGLEGKGLLPLPRRWVAQN